MPKHKRRDINEDEFFGFARAYLSEAFPNPQRVGCPPESDLKQMAETPTEACSSFSQHLTCCSPCFNRYMEILSRLKGQLD